MFYTAFEISWHIKKFCSFSKYKNPFCSRMRDITTPLMTYDSDLLYYFMDISGISRATTHVSSLVPPNPACFGISKVHLNVINFVLLSSNALQMTFNFLCGWSIVFYNEKTCVFHPSKEVLVCVDPFSHVPMHPQFCSTRIKYCS